MFFVDDSVCGTHLLLDIAGSLTEVSWRFNKSMNASPLMIAKYGAPNGLNPPWSPTNGLYSPWVELEDLS